MKRSEMLDILVFSIELHAGNDPSWLEHDPKTKSRAYDHAHKVLLDLEEVGMLPPKAPMNILTGEDHYWEDE